MRVYVSVDMEGLAGVSHPLQTYYSAAYPDRTDYDRSRALMAGEANAAVDGALAAGAIDVVVNDSHWQMRNLRAEEIHPAARLVVGDHPFSMTEGIGTGERFDAAIFIGYHAGAGHPTGVIAHTYASSVVMEVRVGGVPHNEAALNALRLAQHGIPVALVAGDDALGEEIASLLPWAERVVVKEAGGGHLARSKTPDVARQEIRDGVAGALGRLDAMELYAPNPPLSLEVDLRLPVMADYAGVAPGVERLGPRTVGADCADAETLYRWLLTVVRLAAVPAV